VSAWGEILAAQELSKVGEKVFSPNPSSIFMSRDLPRGEAKPTKSNGGVRGGNAFSSLTLPASGRRLALPLGLLI
jgi:hypothetical protein